MAKSMIQADDHAAWMEGTDKVIGLTKDQFERAGLSQLRAAEYTQLLLAMEQNRDTAVKAALASRMIYECGPIPSTYEQVKIYIEVAEDTPSEIASTIRQRISSLRETQIVYSPLEADIGIEIIGAESKVDTGHILEYVVSVITFINCKAALGNQQWTFRSVTDHFIHGGPEASELSNRIVADLDSHDLESIRSFHATARKLGTKK